MCKLTNEWESHLLNARLVDRDKILFLISNSFFKSFIVFGISLRVHLILKSSTYMPIIAKLDSDFFI
jgi:hypothetical protein